MKPLFNGKFARRATGLYFAALLPVFCFALASCPSTDDEGSEEAETGVKITGVSVKPSPGAVARGGYVDFTTTVSGLDFTVSSYGTELSERDQEVSWSIDGAAAATTGIHMKSDGGGRLIVSESETSQTLTVKAKSATDKTKYGISEVAVSMDVATVDSVMVSPLESTVALGGTHIFNAAVTGMNNPDPRVIWTIDGDPSYRSPSTGISGDADGNGILTVAPDETSGILTIRATSLLNGEKYNTVTVIVSSYLAAVDSVTVSPATATLAQGGNLTFSAAVTGRNNPDTRVTWSVLETGRNNGTDITPEGKLIVSSNETLTTLTVKAVSVLNPDKYGTAAVTVTSGTGTVTEVTVSPSKAGMYKGSNMTFVATVTGTGSYSRTVKWSVEESNKNAATVISGAGVLTVAADETLSTLTVKATSAVDTGKYGTATVTVSGGNNPGYYSVVFNAGGGTPVPAVQSVASGGKVSQPADPALDGYTFGGWYKDSAFTTAWNFTADTVTANITLYAKWTAAEAPITYNITYNGNGHTGGTLPASQTKTYGTPLTLQTNSGSLVKTGYVFDGWNTNADGTGTAYAAGGTLNTDLSTTAGAVVTLYAHWTAEAPITYNIIYNDNGSTGGAVPASQTKTIGTPLTLQTNSGSLVKTGYVFDGWNTKADGTGTAYAEGAVLDTDLSTTAGAVVTLYAHWTAEAPITYNITYNGNGHTGGAVPPDQTKTAGTSLTLRKNTGNLVKTGYGMAGWNTKADGSGTTYAAGASMDADLSTTAGSTVVLYARWASPASITYTVSYDGNGSTGGAVPASQTKTMETSLTLRTNTGSLVKTGYVFDGWNTKANGTGTAYAEGASMDADLSTTAGDIVTIYAKWTATYTISYNGNGSTGGAVPASQTKTMGKDLTLQTNSGNLVKTGYVFDGWDTRADGTGTKYAAGAVLSTDLSAQAGATVPLYAHWATDTTQYTVTFDKQGGEGGTDSVTVSYGSAMPSVTPPSRTGYTFGGYYKAAAGGGTQYYTGAGTGALNCDFAENITLYAKWTAVAYSITYNANGGSGDLTPTSYTIESAAITLPTPAREGYAFGGWYEDSDFTGIAVIAIPQGSTGDKTFWASWILIQVIGIDLSNPPASGITGDKWDYANGVYTIKNGADVDVKGSTASDRVTAAGTAMITLDNATINLSGSGSASPVDLGSGANITLKLRGMSTLRAAGSAAGIHVSTGGTLKITSANGDGQTTGMLTASGGGTGGAGAGIGGNMNEPGGTITIAGGQTEAAGGDSASGSWGGAAGIGGGGAADNTTGGGEAGTITITGGIVHATGHCGAGIGGGAYAPNTTASVTISGGEVSASNDDTGAGIGGGEKGAGGIITVSGGTIYASGGAAGIGPGSGGTGGTFNGGAFPPDNPYTRP